MHARSCEIGPSNKDRCCKPAAREQAAEVRSTNPYFMIAICKLACSVMTVRSIAIHKGSHQRKQHSGNRHGSRSRGETRLDADIGTAFRREKPSPKL